ncbi:hypothetical protein R3P38DRAFT_3216386, partial [Favolaschia claudopus]
MRRVANPNRNRPKRTRRIPSYSALGLHLDTQLEPHLTFDLESRLQEEIAHQDPSLPFAGHELPEEQPLPPPPGYANAEVQTDTPSPPQHTQYSRSRAEARVALEREQRFRNQWQDVADARRVFTVPPFNSRGRILVRDGQAFDAALLEDRNYALDEVVGTKSLFRFRLIPWGGGFARPVFSQGRLVLLLLGRADNVDVKKGHLNDINRHCRREAAAYKVRHPADESPVLSGGIGESFNQLPVADKGPEPARVADTLAFAAIFSTIAMCNLLGFVN